MKIQLMIEFDGKIEEGVEIEVLQENERRQLKFFGLERYFKNLIEMQMRNGVTVNFDLRVVKE